MPKVKISEYSATANSNTDVASINIDEGCAPSGINNAIRAVMGHLKDFQQGTNGDPFNGPVNGTVGATTPASGAFTTLSATGNVTLGDASTDTLNVGNGGLIKDASGNVGIGVTSPTSRLHVSHPSASTNAIAQFTNGTTGTGAGNGLYVGIDSTNTATIFNFYNSALQFGTNGATKMLLDTSGNLGIGTTAPQNRLQVVTTTRPQFSVSYNGTTGLYLEDATNSSWKSWKLSTSFGNGSDLSFVQSTNTSGTPTWAATAAMTLDASGNVGIAQTDPTNNGVSGYNNLVIGNSSSSTCGLTFKTTSSGTPYPGIAWSRGAGSGVNGKVYYDQSTDRLYCQAGGSGGVYLAGGGTSWTSASDERVKDIIEPIENATQKLANWRTVIGKYKSDTDGVRRSFLIAQDVLTTFPEAVNTDKAEEYGLNYQDLIPLLVASIQELKAEFDAYKASHP